MLQPWLKGGCIASERARVEAHNRPLLIGQGKFGITAFMLPCDFVLSCSRRYAVR